jgi:hypothetical protein
MENKKRCFKYFAFKNPHAFLFAFCFSTFILYNMNTVRERALANISKNFKDVDTTNLQKLAGKVSLR